MKIMPRYIARKRALKKIDLKKRKRIDTSTMISASLTKEQRKLLSENVDTIARYAHRKGAYLEFVPAEDVFQDSVKMNVYKKGLSVYNGNDGFPYLAFDRKDLSGISILPNDINEAGDLMGFIRKAVKNIVSNDKNWKNKIVEL